MKFYELLGIKVFKKMAFFIRDIVTLPLTFKMSKEERKKTLYNTASNYNIGKSKSLEDIKKQLEEIGTERSQDRPINKIINKIDNLKNEKKELEKYEDEKYEIEKEKI